MDMDYASAEYVSKSLNLLQNPDRIDYRKDFVTEAGDFWSQRLDHPVTSRLLIEALSKLL
jgi:hypothetical protein